MMQSDKNQIYDPHQLFFVAIKFLKHIKDIGIDKKRRVLLVCWTSYWMKTPNVEPKTPPKKSRLISPLVHWEELIDITLMNTVYLLTHWYINFVY